MSFNRSFYCFNKIPTCPNTSCNFFNIAFCFLIIRFSSTKDLIEIIDIAKEKHLKLILGTFDVDCTGDTLVRWLKAWSRWWAYLRTGTQHDFRTCHLRNAKCRRQGESHRTSPHDRCRYPPAFHEKLSTLREAQINQSELARITGLNRGTVRKYIKMLEEIKTKYWEIRIFRKSIFMLLKKIRK